MKALLIGSDSLASGAGLSYIALSEELKALGVDVSLVTRKGVTANMLDKAGVAHRNVNAYSWIYKKDLPGYKKVLIRIVKSALNIPAIIRLKSIIRKEKPDIVHVNTFTSYVGAVAALKTKTPLVWHIREFVEDDFNCEFWNKKRAIRLLEEADCSVAISESVKRKFESLSGKSNIVCIYNGIDLSKYLNPEHKIFESNSTVITVVGRITESKGQLFVVKAISQLLKENSDIELLFAGTGDDNEVSKLKSAISDMGIDNDKVKLLGFVDDIPGLFSRSDIVIVPSKCEAFGRVTVEAMASGCLVIGSDSGGTGELIDNDNDGLLYEQGNADSLVSVLSKALNNKVTMKTLALNGRNKSVGFSARNNAEKIYQQYKRVLGIKEET